jgi:hypothetical protein
MMSRDLQSAYWESSLRNEVQQEELDTTRTGTINETKDLSEEEPEVVFMVQPIREANRPWDRIAFLSMGSSFSPAVVRYPSVHVVEYRLARDVQTKRPVLVRRENPFPTKDLLSGGEEWALADDVVGFEIQCVDASGELSSAWDSSEKGALPRMVLIHLWVGEPGDAEGDPTLYSLRVVLPPSGEEAS